jgi:light-regulated signal transduction histidine kinase (bacteriophytochrome)
MDQLICDLLEFGRLGRTELHKRPVNMQQLVKNVIDDAEPQWSDRDVAWKIGKLCEVDGDPALLRSALANLIDNALKYTRGRPRAEIGIDLTPEGSQPGEATFYVSDNGCGFNMKQAGKLFTPFQRLHSACEYEGTGIGLANVQRIIQKHGGRIWFQSEPNKGATFYFTLPWNGKAAH